MSAIPSTFEPPPGAAPRPDGSGWLISPAQDLGWFIGPAAVGYAALGLLVAGFPFTPIFLFWLVFVDGPHIFATATRTYFDPEARRRLGWWPWVVLPLLAVGPIASMLGQTSLFLLFAVSWQHYHIAKQHLGFVMLWRAKRKERDPAGMVLDRRFVLVSTLLPLALFVARTRLPQLPVVEAVELASILGYVALLAAYVATQVRTARAGGALNPGKLGLLAVLVPLQWLAFAAAASRGPDGIIYAGISLGLFHSLQYHRLVWFHNENRYRDTTEATHGLAFVASRSVLRYTVLVLAMNFTFFLLPRMFWPTSELVNTAMWGIAFTHYLIDAQIWHVRADKELAAALGIAR